MSSVVGIWSMAAGCIGESNAIASEDERSQAADQCRTYYEQSRDVVLEAYDWGFARKRIDLALSADTIPTLRWQYMYIYPVDCLKARYLDDGSRGQTDPVPYEISMVNSKTVIMTDMQNAKLCYTTKIADPNKFSPSFIEALCWYLGAKISIPITRKRELYTSCMQTYGQIIGVAAAQNLNEHQYDQERDPELIRARS